MSELIKKISQERPSQAPFYETYDLLQSAGHITQPKADLVSLSPDAVLRLQRTLGNQRVQRLIAKQQSNLPSPRTKPNLHQKDDEITAASVVPLTTAFDPAAKKAHQEVTLRSGNVQFRIPEFEQISQAYLDEEHTIPQDVIKLQVRHLLMRMSSENRLKTEDSIKTIIKKIFPKSGEINKAAFEAVVDTSDRSRIYKSVFDAAAQVKGEDKPKLMQLIDESIVLVGKALQNSDGLAAVFGSKSEKAKETYTEARKKLKDILVNVDQYITTDYNGDSEQVGIGGGTNFDLQKIHLALEIVQCKDANATKWTLIHEACHLARGSVTDNGGYYGSPGFEAKSDEIKVNNAAHYEELPKRELGISSYPKVTFRERSDKSNDPVSICVGPGTVQLISTYLCAILLRYIRRMAAEPGLATSRTTTLPMKFLIISN